MLEKNHSALEVIRKVIRYVSRRKLYRVTVKRGNLTSLGHRGAKLEHATWQFNYMMKMLVYTQWCSQDFIEGEAIVTTQL